jgi:hypothetical protein
MSKRLTTMAEFVDNTIDTVEDNVEVVESATVVNADLVNARVKGTWVMYWGKQVFDFKDGARYRLPRDLFQYLKKNGNIYDTMA